MGCCGGEDLPYCKCNQCTKWMANISGVAGPIPGADADGNPLCQLGPWSSSCEPTIASLGKWSGSIAFEGTRDYTDNHGAGQCGSCAASYDFTLRRVIFIPSNTKLEMKLEGDVGCMRKPSLGSLECKGWCGQYSSFDAWSWHKFSLIPLGSYYDEGPWGNTAGCEEDGTVDYNDCRGAGIADIVLDADGNPVNRGTISPSIGGICAPYVNWCGCYEGIQYDSNGIPDTAGYYPAMPSVWCGCDNVQCPDVMSDSSLCHGDGPWPANAGTDEGLSQAQQEIDACCCSPTDSSKDCTKQYFDVYGMNGSPSIAPLRGEQARALNLGIYGGQDDGTDPCGPWGSVPPSCQTVRLTESSEVKIGTGGYYLLEYGFHNEANCPAGIGAFSLEYTPDGQPELGGCDTVANNDGIHCKFIWDDSVIAWDLQQSESCDKLLDPDTSFPPTCCPCPPSLSFWPVWGEQQGWSADGFQHDGEVRITPCQMAPDRADLLGWGRDDEDFPISCIGWGPNPACGCDEAECSEIRKGCGDCESTDYNYFRNYKKLKYVPNMQDGGIGVRYTIEAKLNWGSSGSSNQAEACCCGISDCCEYIWATDTGEIPFNDPQEAGHWERDWAEGVCPEGYQCVEPRNFDRPAPGMIWRYYGTCEPSNSGGGPPVSDFPDLDLYGTRANWQGFPYPSVWYDQFASGGLALNQDVYPNCINNADPPELITGTFTTSGTEHFRFWYNQHSDCAPETSPITTSITVTNTGDVPIDVNETLVEPGGSWTTNVIEYTGFDKGGQPDYVGVMERGTKVLVTAANNAWGSDGCRHTMHPEWIKGPCS